MHQPSCVVLSLRPEEEPSRWVHRCLTPCADFDLRTARGVAGLAGGRNQLIVLAAHGAALDADIAELTHVRLKIPGVPVLVVGADLDRPQISRVLAEGAYDYVSVGTSDHELVARVMRGLRFLPRCDDQVPQSGVAGLIGSSPAFAKVLSRLPLLAHCNANVLIQGETGTGKELFAQAIHYLSGRESHPWVPVNCGAIPAELMEAELFGHTKGAYTSANFAREGLIATAEGGTLFLDEIDSLALPLQSKLLRFLQEKEYRPVGSTAVRRASVRVVAASNCDLARAVSAGRFRQDLYFRLNVLTIRLPALRDRRADIPELARHFLRQFAAELARPVRGISPAVMQRLLTLDWPGNVRELAHTLERAVLLCRGDELRSADLDLDADEPAEPALDESFQSAKARVVEQFERNYLERVLAANNGNIAHAARAAKKNRRALFELIRKHGIEAEQFKG
jgi:two-component system response regulator GlrR